MGMLQQSEHLYYQEFQGSNHHDLCPSLFLYKNNNTKLIYIRSTMEPKNYSIAPLGSILKEQGEKIAPCIFKINDILGYCKKRKDYEIKVCDIIRQKAKILKRKII